MILYADESACKISGNKHLAGYAVVNAWEGIRSIYRFIFVVSLKHSDNKSPYVETC